MDKGKANDKVLVITDDTTFPDISQGKVRHHSCPPGYSIGAIVHRRDWADPAMFGVYGEAVYVSPITRDVKFIDEDNGLSCTVLKNEKLKCVARIYGRKVSWA